MEDEDRDPFGLDGVLFSFVAARMQPSGEAFTAYRLRGQPMILRSQIDGLPICALHLLVVDGAPILGSQ